jgi:AraC family transcriptional regulator
MLVTHGVVLFQRESGRYRITETQHPAGFALPRHAHDRSALTLVLEGSFSETIRASEWTCEHLSLVFKPAGLEHANRYGPRGATSFIVEFDGATHAPPLGPGDFTQLLVPMALAARDALMHPASTHLAAEALIHEITSPSRDREGSAKPPWLNRIVARLRESITDPPGLEELGIEAGVHPVHVSRAFRRSYGITMTRFLARCRIAEGIRQLARGAPIPTTAIGLGYYDQSHFTTAFRRETGMTPAAWQRLSGKRRRARDARR